MTGSEIITKFINMVDDELDNDYMYQLMNDAKNEIEAENAWEILKDKETITSASTSLPSDFCIDVLLTDGTSVYTKVNKEESEIEDGSAFKYYLDMKNDKLEVINYDNSSLSLYYIGCSDDITSSTSWVFPARFHSLLAYKMAQLYYASDAGEKSRSWDDRWQRYYNQNKEALYVWNDSLKVRNREPNKRGLAPTQLPYYR